jgi:hypothetical protein
MVCPTLAGLAPSQFLQSYTDFQGHTTDRLRSDYLVYHVRHRRL